MREEEVVFIFNKEENGFRFALIEKCPSEYVAFAVGVSEIVPVLSDRRISESELKIEFSDSLENAISIVNDVFGTNHHKDNIKKVESVSCGRRLLCNNKSTIFSVDFE